VNSEAFRLNTLGRRRGGVEVVEKECAEVYEQRQTVLGVKIEIKADGQTRWI
jgi:hypothetical protein